MTDRKHGTEAVLERPACLRAVLACGLLAALASCRTDFDRMRRDHAEEFLQQAAERTVQAVPEGEALGLDDCVRIALANNLALKSADIQTMLATLDRKTAFGNFLPRVDLTVSYARNDKPPATKFSMPGMGEREMQIADQAITQTTISAQQPIFVPQAWFLYSAFQKGEDISRLVEERTRQMITLQVTALYFTCLIQEKAAGYLQTDVKEAELLFRAAKAMEREGFMMPQQRYEAELLLLTRKKLLADNARARRQTGAALLEAMGLSPLGQISLREETPISMDDQPLADQVLEAMLNRPELKIEDRQIEISKDQVRMAIAAFLPNLMGFAQFSHTTDSSIGNPSAWTLGASGVLSVFNGFRDINEYRAAKQRREQSFIRREQACLTVMLEVLTARLRVQETEEQLLMAEKNLEAAEENLKEVLARWDEGMVLPTERLRADSRRAQAQVGVVVATFQRQVAAATLSDVIGRSRHTGETEHKEDR